MESVRTQLSSRGAVNPNTLLDAKQVAEIIGMTVDFVYKLCRENEIPYIKLGRSYRFRLGSILEWLAARERNRLADRVKAEPRR